MTHLSVNLNKSYDTLAFIGENALRLSLITQFHESDPNIDSAMMSTLITTNLEDNKLALATISMKLYEHVPINSEPICKEVLLYNAFS